MTLSLQRALLVARSKLRDQTGCYFYHPFTLRMAIVTLENYNMPVEAAAIKRVLQTPGLACATCKHDSRPCE